MKTPHHKLILEYLRQKGIWVNKRDIEEFGRSIGAFGNTAVRRIQEMCQPTHRNYQNGIQHKQEEGIAWFCFKSENLPTGELMTTRTAVYSENRQTFNLDPNFCCASKKFYGICARDCQKQVIKQLF